MPAPRASIAVLAGHEDDGGEVRSHDSRALSAPSIANHRLVRWLTDLEARICPVIAHAYE